jgi:hypothetical protein
VQRIGLSTPGRRQMLNLVSTMDDAGDGCLNFGPARRDLPTIELLQVAYPGYDRRTVGTLVMRTTYVPGVQAHIHRDKARLRPPMRIAKKSTHPVPTTTFKPKQCTVLPCSKAKIMRHKHKGGVFLIRRWVDYHPALQGPIEEDWNAQTLARS